MSLSRFLPCCVVVAFACVLNAGFQGGSGRTVWFDGARLIVGNGSAPIENSAFVVEGDSFTWVGRKGERQPPPGAARVDLTGKTVMPSLIDGHNHIGLVDERDGSNSKANYTHDNLVYQFERYA
jgi:imidazolonepropionase-like amidohydrolase